VLHAGHHGGHADGGPGCATCFSPAAVQGHPVGVGGPAYHGAPVQMGGPVMMGGPQFGGGVGGPPVVEFGPPGGTNPNPMPQKPMN
jgi:hypothetical protein